jgi:DNA-binding transcriptional MocR family regulator
MQTTQSEVAPDVIDFGIGHPAAELLPRTILQRAAAQRLAQDDSSLLQYGLEQGDGYFRHALGDFLTARYGFSVGMDDLFVTNGASLALDLICTLYTQPGDVIFVEEPSYFLALRIFADHRLHVVSIPTDTQGLDVDALEAALALQRPALLYTIPTHQNPSGATLPLARRQKLVELSQRHGFLIVADEVYHLLSYTEAPPPPLAQFAEGGTVLALGSFSKILAPGLRLGWVQAAHHHLKRLVESGLLDSGGGLNPFTSGLVRVVLEQGWQAEYLAHLRATYRARIAALGAALRRELGDLASFAEPEGGYFFWVRLPDHVDTAALMDDAAAQKVGFRPGVRFSSRNGLHNYLRLSFAFYDGDQLDEGVRRLARVLK